jgi:hypothetical protein
LRLFPTGDSKILIQVERSGGHLLNAGVVVLGMHRSGTSLIAEMVHRWGAYGRAEDCLPPDQWNARGYWELAPLVEFNSWLLAEVGASWNFPPGRKGDIQLARLAQAGSYRDTAMDLLSSMQQAGGSWYWKDPRLALLLPFWQKIWGDVRYVICVRDPAEICASLRERDQLSHAISIVLWQRYMLSILQWTRNAPSIFMSYSAVLREPDTEGARLARFLDGQAECSTRMTAAVDSALRHFTAGSGRPQLALTNKQQELYQSLKRRAQCGLADMPFDLERCLLPGIWRSLLKGNLLFLRCQRRWNRAFAQGANCSSAILTGEP